MKWNEDPNDQNLENLFEKENVKSIIFDETDKRDGSNNYVNTNVVLDI